MSLAQRSVVSVTWNFGAKLINLAVLFTRSIRS
jgi:hypothetical protein